MFHYRCVLAMSWQFVGELGGKSGVSEGSA